MQSGIETVLVTVEREQVLRWDEEWLQYFKAQPLAPHLLDGREMSVVSDIAGRSAEEVYATVIATPAGTEPAAVSGAWVPGDALKGRKVVEFGSGTGGLAKQLGAVCDEYLGLELSRVPITLAAERSPPACRFLHFNDHDELRPLAGRYDTVLGREFFAHQNYYASLDYLRLARALLRPGGRVYADFFMVVWGVPVGVIHPARAEADLANVSCGYYYSEEDVRHLGQASGMRVIEQAPREELLRRYAVFEKPASGAPSPEDVSGSGLIGFVT